MSLTTKQRIHQYCVSEVETRISAIQAVIQSAEQAQHDDTKSSAGDKFETSREMMNAERSRQQVQLAESLKLKAILEMINPNKQLEIITLGSLVFTNQGTYYISIGLGKVVIKEETFFCISLQSPIGKLLNGCLKGDRVSFRNKAITIQEIY